jgi:hypothetical protein
MAKSYKIKILILFFLASEGKLITAADGRKYFVSLNILNKYVSQYKNSHINNTPFEQFAICVKP